MGSNTNFLFGSFNALSKHSSYVTIYLPPFLTHIFSKEIPAAIFDCLDQRLGFALFNFLLDKPPSNLLTFLLPLPLALFDVAYA